MRKQTLNESKEGRGTKVLYVGDISVALQKKVCSTKNGVWLGKKEDWNIFYLDGFMVSRLTNGCLELQEEINVKKRATNQYGKGSPFKKLSRESWTTMLIHSTKNAQSKLANSALEISNVDLVKKGNKLAHLAFVTVFFAPSHTRMQLHIIC